MEIRSWGWVLMGCSVSISALAQEGGVKSKATNSYVLLSVGQSNTPAACEWSGDRMILGGAVVAGFGL